MEHAISTVGGKVPADERLRLVNIHGADKAAALIEAHEAALAAPVQEAEPTKTKGRKAADEEMG